MVRPMAASPSTTPSSAPADLAQAAVAVECADEVVRRATARLAATGVDANQVLAYDLAHAAAGAAAGRAVLDYGAKGPDEARIACAFVGLCYAEMAAMIPVSGSAYTYAYVTVGEIFAWIIGWDLILEYAMGASTVAVGWSAYFVSLLKSFGIAIPPQWSDATGSAVTLGDGSSATAFFNLPAVATATRCRSTTSPASA